MAAYPYYGPYYQQPRQEYPPMPPQAAPQGFSASVGGNIQPGFSCRPVTSREEAAAIQVDFFGPGTVMPDLGHGVIYLKRFNQQTGACDIYEFYAAQPQKEETVQYATMEDLNALREELMQHRKGGKKNDADE